MFTIPWTMTFQFHEQSCSRTRLHEMSTFTRFTGHEPRGLPLHLSIVRRTHLAIAATCSYSVLQLLRDTLNGGLTMSVGARNGLIQVYLDPFVTTSSACHCTCNKCFRINTRLRQEESCSPLAAPSRRS